MFSRVRDAIRFCLEQTLVQAPTAGRESFYILVPLAAPPRKYRQDHRQPTGDRDVLDNLYCLRCNRELEAGQKSVAVYLFAQTVGVRPRQKSSAQRICFCPQCSVSLAMGPAPEGALNLAAWQMIRDIVGADPALTEAAWESLHGVEEGLLPATGTNGGAHPGRAGSYLEF
jgi:hypothetical protein